MGKGMFIQCHGCGYTEHVSLEGNFDAREKELQRMLDEGWRWAVNWQGFLCPKCFRGDPWAMRCTGPTPGSRSSATFSSPTWSCGNARTSSSRRCGRWGEEGRG